MLLLVSFIFLNLKRVSFIWIPFYAKIIYAPINVISCVFQAYPRRTRHTLKFLGLIVQNRILYRSTFVPLLRIGGFKRYLMAANNDLAS